MKEFIKKISNLSTVKRYSQSTLCCPESVLEHSASVTLMALYIGTALNSKNMARIDIGLLLSKAAIHDFDEIITGDVARPVKYFSKEMREMFKQLESENMEILTKSFSSGNEHQKVLYDFWDSAKDGLEGSIVALCDFISVIQKLYDEIVMRGNKSMFRYFDTSYVDYCGRLFSELEHGVELQRMPNLNLFLNESGPFMMSLRMSVLSMIDEIRLEQ